MAHLSKKASDTIQDPLESSALIRSSGHVSFQAGSSNRRLSNHRHLSKSKTIFHLAHPPPIKNSQKLLKIRPSVLLQLQQLPTKSSSHAVPALDVLPSSIFGTRLPHRLSKIFDGKHSLGPDDLVVVSSDSSEDANSALADSDLLSENHSDVPPEVIGTICLPRKFEEVFGDVEVCLDRGLTWQAKRLLNGIYEFSTTNSDGSQSRARWVPRPISDHTTVGGAERVPNTCENVSKRFTFSVIDPNARRHPVIASMTSSNIEVPEHLPLSVFHPGKSTPFAFSGLPASASTDSDSFWSSDQMRSTALSQLRSMILVTGIFVVFREGWSTNFSYRHKNVRTNSPSNPKLESYRGRTSTSILRSHSFSKTSAHKAPSLKRANSVGAAYIARKNQRSNSAQSHHDEERSPVLSKGHKERVLRPSEGFRPFRALSLSFSRHGLQTLNTLTLLQDVQAPDAESNGHWESSIVTNSSSPDSDKDEEITASNAGKALKCSNDKDKSPKKWTKVWLSLRFAVDGHSHRHNHD